MNEKNKAYICLLIILTASCWRVTTSLKCRWCRVADDVYKLSVFSGVTRGWGRGGGAVAPGDTIEGGGVTPEWGCTFCGWIYQNTGTISWKAECERWWCGATTKKVSQFFRLKKVTPSVSALGDTNRSDATESVVFLHLPGNVCTQLRWRGQLYCEWMQYLFAIKMIEKYKQCKDW